MTTPEAMILHMLGEVWNKFCNLPQTHAEGGHKDDVGDFRFHLHALENLVAARTGFAQFRQKGRDFS